MPYLLTQAICHSKLQLSELRRNDSQLIANVNIQCIHTLVCPKRLDHRQPKALGTFDHRIGLWEVHYSLMTLMINCTDARPRALGLGYMKVRFHCLEPARGRPSTKL